MICPLCYSSNSNQFLARQKPDAKYWHCHTCDLIFLDPEQRLSFAQEKERYHDHENSNPDYENYFREFVLGLKSFLPVRGLGLDFGSGPVPVLAELLRKEGYMMNCYDIHFAPQSDVFELDYDFITATEVFEHLSEPAAVISRLKSKLVKGGVLAIATSLHQPIEDDYLEFSKWHYRRDPTHISFYSLQTLKWIASHFNLELLHSTGPRHFFRRK